MISNVNSKHPLTEASVNLCRRMALGALALLVLGPLIAGCTLVTVIMVFRGVQAWRPLPDWFSIWLKASWFASSMVYRFGWMPAALVGALMGVFSRWISRGWFIFGSVVGSIAITFVWFAVSGGISIGAVFVSALFVPSVVGLSYYLHRSYGRTDAKSIESQCDSFEIFPEAQMNGHSYSRAGEPSDVDGQTETLAASAEEGEPVEGPRSGR